MVFGQKQLFFVFEVFGQIQSGNIVSDVLDRKKFCLDKKSQFSKNKKNSKKSKFSKGVSLKFLAKNGHFFEWRVLGISSKETSFI